MTARNCVCGCPADAHAGGRCDVADCGCLSYAPAPGRPRGSTKPAARSKTTRIDVYVTPDEAARLRRAAARSGKSVSGFVASAALDAAIGTV